MRSRDVIFVIGMHRSGSSALTRVLSLCGCTLPPTVLGAHSWNPTGNWDPVDAVKLNTEFLLRHETMFDDPTVRFQELAIDDVDREEHVAKIEAFLSNCPTGPTLVIKDQYITLLTEYWLQAARRAGLSPKIVIPVRHPGEVYKSYSAGTGSALRVEPIHAMWLKINLLAERHSRNLPRVFVEYGNLMENWRREIGRISKRLDIDMASNEAAINGFLSRDLHHHKCQQTFIESFSNGWMSRLYSILSIAARDGDVAEPELDEIYSAYCADERVFRVSWDSFREKFDPNLTRERQEKIPVWKRGQDF